MNITKEMREITDLISEYLKDELLPRNLAFLERHGFQVGETARVHETP